MSSEHSPAEPGIAAPEDQPGVISVRELGKCYHVYERPQDRLKQALLRGRRTFHREFWALRGVSFSVRRGEAVGIIGRNGSGKSTLLQVIAGTLSPTEGEARVAGRIAALLELGSGFDREFTGRENVYLNGAILGFSKAQMDEKIDAIAAFADIGAFLDQPIKVYSSGMLVRLAFAVQVQVEPDVLIIDEALAVGDALFQKRCYQRIEELKARGVTLLFVSHSQEAVRTLTDRAVLLHEGRVRAQGPSAEVLLEYRRLLHEDEKRWLGHEAARLTGRADAHRESGGSNGDASSDKRAFGDFDAAIVEVAVLDGAGAPMGACLTGDRVLIRVACRAEKEIDHLNVAVRLRNKEGVKMYSWGTLNQDMAIDAGLVQGERFWDRRFSAGEMVTVDFEFECRLGGNLYEVQAAVTQEELPYYGGWQRTLHWRDEAAFFQVHQQPREYFFGGVTDMRMIARVRD